MAVDDRSSLFAARVDEWQRCRDALAGTDAIKAAGERYLPRLAGQGIVSYADEYGFAYTVNEYDAYRDRALWYNATLRTLQGIRGALCRRPPAFTVPRAMKAHLDDVTLAGESGVSFVQRAITEVLSVGLFGVLVDLPVDSTLGRPYWVGYPVEQILRTRMVNLDGVWTLGQVVLEEEVPIEGQDEFDEETETRWRVIDLDEAGYYRVRVFVRASTQRRPELAQVLEPTIRGERLRYVPFVCLGPSSLKAEPEKPPLLDLIDVNISHYRTSADLEEGRHKLALPTPWAVGFPIDTKLRLGANVAHVSDNPQASMGMLEFSGAGLGELREALREKEALMAAIGARLLESPKAGIESAEAIRLRTSGEQSFLMTMAQTMSEGFTTVLQYHALWMGLDDLACTATINNDFVEVKITPQEQAQNMAEYQADLISYATWWWRSARGELMRPNTTPEEERAEIEAERPVGGEMDVPDEDRDDETDEEDAA